MNIYSNRLLSPELPEITGYPKGEGLSEIPDNIQHFEHFDRGV